ncbi:MAG TPA: ATP-binding protein [Planctomycetota bacterium]|jgi:PAS domain S-box-containing protein
MWGSGQAGGDAPGAGNPEEADDFRIRLSAAPEAIILLTRSGRLVLLNSAQWDPESIRDLPGGGETIQMRLPLLFRSGLGVELGLFPVGSPAKPPAPPTPSNGGGEAREGAPTAQAAAYVGNVDDAIVGLSPEGTITYWSPGAQRLYGYSPEEAMGRPLTALVPPERFAEERRTLEKVLKGERVPASDTERRRKDGSTVDVSRALLPVTGSDGAVSGAAEVARDISVRRKAEKDLVRQVADLTRSNADLEEYALRVAHDLQAPLRMVSAYTRMLAKKPQDAETGDLMISAEEGMRRMEGLIRHLLDYARLEANPAKFEKVDIASVLEQALANLKLAIKESGARVTHDKMPSVQGDSMQLAEVFQNLIGNALRYRGHAPPVIHIAAEKRAGEWRFSVHDNGSGIPPEQVRRLFRPLERMARNGIEPGAGLGLAIAKKIVTRHGGRIWAESEVGKGTTFHFTLPEAA